MDKPSTHRVGRYGTYAAIAALYAGIAWLDLMLPLGIAVWPLYLFPLWLLSRLRPFDARVVYGGSGLTTGLIIINFLLSPSGPSASTAALNRGIGISLVWIITLLLARARRQESALLESQERLRMALDSAGLGMWDQEMSSRRIVWNERAYELLGYQPPKPAAGEALWKAAVHPADAEQAADEITYALKGRSIYRHEHRIIRRDTGEIRWIAPYGRFLYDGSGRAQRFVGVFSDITERKLSEEALLQSEAQFRINFELAAVGQAQVSVTTGRFIRVNNRFCDIAGYPAASLMGMTPHDLTHPDDRSIDGQQVERLLRGEVDEYHCENRYLRQDGDVRWVRVSARLIRNAAGGPARTIAVVEDITERKEAEAALLRLTLHLEQRVEERTKALTESQRRLRALTSELNLTEQRERRRLAGELHDYLAQLLVVGRMKIGQALQRIGQGESREQLTEADQALDESLTYTRSLVAQLAPPVLQQFGLSAALSWLGDEFRRHGLSVTVEAPPEPPPLSADQAGLLFQSVRELLMNVVKHAKTDAAFVTLHCERRRLILTVQDRGSGFDQILEQEAKDKLGLFSVRERMHALGGSFTLDSSPGTGTLATFILPLTTGESASPAEGEQEGTDRDRPAAGGEGRSGRNGDTAEAGASRPIRVLLVDDHTLVREGLRSLLSDYPDIEVVGEAGNGEEAVELSRHLLPRVIVMDVNMPKMDGIEATRIIARSLPSAVIGLSVNASRRVRDSMSQAGAYALLTKESVAESLYRTIKRAADGAIGQDDQEVLPFSGADTQS
ncbi:MAG: PAS domain S-box protein [Nitrospira sp.]|nr:PAS domain S-box protein [Nitrospira sp.]